MTVTRAAVVGAGTMGGEIAQVLAAAGVQVVLKDVEQRFVDIGLQEAREVTAAGKLDQQGQDALLERITGATSYDGFGDVGLVIEAVPEVMAVKQAVFAELDAATPGHAILASNTSSLSITEIGDATTRPDRVVGFHFFYPASMMRLIEVVEGADTSDETLQAAVDFAAQIRKTAIRCGEAPGFVVNRILNSATSEVWRIVDEEGISYADADAAVKDSGVAPVGPYHLVDLLGLDTVLHVAEHLHESYGERFYVSPAMQRLVAEGHLGVKTGKGFYEH